LRPDFAVARAALHLQPPRIMRPNHSGRRPRPWLLYGCAAAAFTLLPTGGATAQPAEVTGAVVRVQATSAPPGSGAGAGFVIFHGADGAGSRPIYIATSARLFDPRHGGGARVWLPAGPPIDVPPQDVLVPGHNWSDMAILRLTTERAAPAAAPVVFDPVESGGLFVIAGIRADGSIAVAPERAAFVATRTIVGDRPAAHVEGCLGAPALIERGVFGIVSECEPNLAPVVLPLAVARGFMTRTIPDLQHTSETGAQFTLTEREVAVPPVMVPGGGSAEGEYDIPLRLTASEAVFGATARVTERRGVRLADVAITGVTPEGVRLRFTLGGEPAPAVPESWSEALIVVRINVVSLTGGRP
jgi:hypothetical protein